MYKVSKYNVIFNYEDYVVMFNTFSKNIVRFPINKKTDIEEIINNSNFIKNTWTDYFFRKGFLVDENINEVGNLYNQCKENVNGKLLHLTIMPTYCCNLSCIYCFQNHISNSFMTEETMKKILMFVQNNLKNYDGLYVDWFGGEPLINKEKVLDMNKEFRRYATESKKPYVSRITTNGYELDLETFTNLFKNNCFIYYVSVDGSEEVHNMQRPHKNGKGSFKRIIDNLEMIRNSIKSQNFRIEIRVNNSLDTLKSIKTFFKIYANKFGTDKRFVLVLDSIQNWSDKTEDIKDELLKERDIEDLGVLALSYGIQLANSTMNSLTTQICQAAKKNAYSIFYDGTVHKCQMALEQEEYRELDTIGEITDIGTLEIDKKKESKWVNDTFPEYCSDCVALPLCLGKKCVFVTNVKTERCENIEDKLISTLKLQELSNINKIELYKEI